jgi:hypothetical protein
MDLGFLPSPSRSSLRFPSAWSWWPFSPAAAGAGRGSGSTREPFVDGAPGHPSQRGSWRAG